MRDKIIGIIEQLINHSINKEEAVKRLQDTAKTEDKKLLLSYSRWWDKKYSPQRNDFHRHKDIDAYLEQKG
jgi:hypothetical protein